MQNKKIDDWVAEMLPGQDKLWKEITSLQSGIAPQELEEKLRNVFELLVKQLNIYNEIITKYNEIITKLKEQAQRSDSALNQIGEEINKFQNKFSQSKQSLQSLSAKNTEFQNKINIQLPLLQNENHQLRQIIGDLTKQLKDESVKLYQNIKNQNEKAELINKEIKSLQETNDTLLNDKYENGNLKTQIDNMNKHIKIMYCALFFCIVCITCILCKDLDFKALKAEEKLNNLKKGASWCLEGVYGALSFLWNFACNIGPKVVKPILGR